MITGEVIKALQRGWVPQILPGSVPYSAFKTVCNFAFDFVLRPSGVLLPAGVLQFSCILCGRSVRLHLHNGCWGAGSNPGFPPSAGPRSPLPQAGPADFTCTGAAILIRGVRVGHREVSRWGAAACTLSAEKPRRRGAAGHAGTVPPRWAAPSCRARLGASGRGGCAGALSPGWTEACAGAGEGVTGEDARPPDLHVAAVFSRGRAAPPPQAVTLVGGSLCGLRRRPGSYLLGFPCWTPFLRPRLTASSAVNRALLQIRGVWTIP